MNGDVDYLLKVVTTDIDGDDRFYKKHGTGPAASNGHPHPRFKFLRELYQSSYFYHSGDLHPVDAPSEKIEDRIADAAETVLAEQVQKDVDQENKSEDNISPNNELPSIIEK